MPKIRVLVVDDSATIRILLAKGIALDPELEVVGTAPDPYIARNKIEELTPDVITLDVEMPRMDGIEFLRRVMASYPLPVIMVSALTEKGKRITLDALDAGAFDFVHKPSGSHGALGLQDMLQELRTKIKAAARANVTTLRKSLGRIATPASEVTRAIPRATLGETTDKVVAIGASTGGTTAIRDIVNQLPADFPGIVAVQHITPGFTSMFAERLNEIGTIQVKEAKTGDRVITGRMLVAPSGHQMTVRRTGGFYYVDCIPGPPVCGHIPSVEALFQSVAKHVGAHALGVILTGMGGDGADGLAAMRKAGARTLGQDEASCVVYGMPKVAWEKGGVEKQVPLEEMVANLPRLLRSK